MKYLKLLVIFFVMIFTSCHTNLTPPDFSQVDSISEPITIDLDDYDAIYSQYISMVFHSSMLYYSWQNANEIPPEKFSSFYTNLISNKLVDDIDRANTNQVNADMFEAAIMKYFSVSQEHLRMSENYNPDAHTYIIWGIGGAISCQITSTNLKDNLLDIEFSVFGSENDLISTGIITIQLSNNDSFQYVSCVVDD